MKFSNGTWRFSAAELRKVPDHSTSRDSAQPAPAAAQNGVHVFELIQNGLPASSALSYWTSSLLQIEKSKACLEHTIWWSCLEVWKIGRGGSRIGMYCLVELAAGLECAVWWS